MNAASVCRPASIDFLYPGMYIMDDIYDYTANNLLLPAGRTLDDALIDKMKRFNKMQKHIYVSERTYTEMRESSGMIGDILIESKKLESKTGYTDIIGDTTDLIRNIAGTAQLSKETVYSISEEVALRLKITKTDVVFDIINALAPVDEYLQRHVVNVSMLNGLMGQWLGMSNDEINSLILIGLLHDCGKAIIPLDILNAPRKLTTVEFEVMKTHPLYSYMLLKDLPEEIRLGALYHHEKMDGAGYPRNLNSDSLPLSARITSVSDIYDAMVSRRVYKEPISPFSVLSALDHMRGNTLDPLLVDTFLERIPDELIGKPVLLSDGRTGIVKESDPANIEYPLINLNDSILKTNKDLFCVSMLTA